MNDSEDGEPDPCFVYDESTRAGLRRLTQFVESLFDPPRQSAATLQALARALHVLRRLPQPTYDITGSVDLSYHFGGEVSFAMIDFNEESIKLTTGPGYESFSIDCFEMYTDVPCNGGESVIEDWIDKALAIKPFARVEFEMMNEDDGIDWESDDDATDSDDGSK